uniref:G-protein coupled receptors family 1 profile domain-containing protein n=1 Tax=Globodera rostochiensis TaxID=31243 RepID=A0A914HU95_GLORO
MSTNSTINEVFYELANARPCWIVYVTLRTKSMNNSANKLLAIYSFFEIVHQSVGCTNFLLFFTSIDRLIAVIFPLRQSENVFFYVITLPFIGLYYVYALYSQSCHLTDETVITGTINDIGMAAFQCTNSAASNAPILYFTSKEYRKAFDKEWQTINKLFNRNSFVAIF